MSRKDLESYHKKVGYRKHAGWFMWKFHRYSGVLLGIFLILHIFLMSGMFEFLAFLKAPSHIAGVAAIFILHTINGIRIMLMEFSEAIERNKFIKYVTGAALIMAVLVVLFIVVGGYIPIIIDEYFGGHKGV